MVSLAQRVRSLVAQRTDPYVLRRFDALSQRGDLGREPAAVDRVALDAYSRFVERHPGRIADAAHEAVVVDAFVGLYDDDELELRPSRRVQDAIVQQFNRLYYHSGDRTWEATTYRGTVVWKCPIDLWAYQELIHETEPDLIIETGTAHGGSARYLADLCDLLGRGQVVSIDIEVKPGRPEHPRLSYLTGSSVAPDIVRQVEAMRPESGRVLVILDSDHSEAHVRAELDTWASWVPVGSYVIVEDTNVNGHPVLPRHGPGPMEALDSFLADDDRFEIDEDVERRLLTFNPRGYLKRVR